MTGNPRRRLALFALGALLLFLSPLGARAALTTSNLGKEFFITFPDQFIENSAPHQRQLFVTSASAVSGNVEIPALAFSAGFTVPAGGMTIVALPDGAAVSLWDGTATKAAVHLTADGDVGVYAFAYEQYATEAGLALPVSALGMDYMVGVNFSESFLAGSVTEIGAGEFSVVAVQDGTTVTVVPPIAEGAHPAGAAYSVHLDRGDIYGLIDHAAGGDLTGTKISSDRPVAVFNGNRLADIPDTTVRTANYLYEQAWPVADWGTHFITVPFATRTHGDLFRVLAYYDGTDVYFGGVKVATLAAGGSYKQQVTAASEVTTSHPALLSQFSYGHDWDGTQYCDPFLVTVPPVSSYAATYIVGAPVTGFPNNYLNLSALSADAGSVLLDGTAIPAAVFTPVGSSGYSAAQVTVGTGGHALSAPQGFGVVSYGYADRDGYGYPGALQLQAAPPAFTPTPTFTPTVTMTPTITSTPTPTATPTPPFHIWPNPFDPSTAVEGALKAGYLEGGEVDLYTVSGEKVVGLKGENGWFSWSPKAMQGKDLAAGVYYCVARQKGKTVAKQVLIVR